MTIVILMRLRFLSYRKVSAVFRDGLYTVKEEDISFIDRRQINFKYKNGKNRKKNIKE